MSQNPSESQLPGGSFPGQVPGTQASSAPAQRLVASQLEGAGLELCDPAAAELVVILDPVDTTAQVD